jgi:hypothetical protein
MWIVMCWKLFKEIFEETKGNMGKVTIKCHMTKICHEIKMKINQSETRSFR